MTRQMWFTCDDARIRETLDAAFSWCDEWSLVTDAPSAQLGESALWVHARHHAERGHVLPSKHRHLLWFEKGNDVRFVLAPNAMSAGSLSGPGVWVFWEGPREALPDGLQDILDESRAASADVEPNSRATPSDLTAEHWRDCLMSAIEEGARVDRDQAVRSAFKYAQATYGLSAQRLRAGGRADQALRSAINGAIRKGLLERDGAAYLVRVGPSAQVPPLPPVLDAAPEPTPDMAAPQADTPTPANVAEPTSPYDRPLESIDFPARMFTWAESHGISTVRAFLELSPESLTDQKNVGRRTLAQTRERIEALFGCSWEEAHRAARGGSEAPPAAEDKAEDSVEVTAEGGGAAGWTALASALIDDERQLHLLDVELPGRMKTFVRTEGLERLGDLFRLSYTELADRPNLGRKSLNDTLEATRDFLRERTAPIEPTFLDSWQAQLSALEPVARMVVTRRAGMHGARETLEELAGMLGVTRERVRQIEIRVIQRLAERSRWRRTVEASLSAAFGAARAIPLALLAQDPWWVGIDQKELLLDFVVRRLFEDELFILDAPSGKRYLAKFRDEEFVERLEATQQRVAKLDYPVELRSIEELLHAEAASLDPVMFGEFEHAVRELLQLDTDRPDLALGYGRQRSDEVIAFLNKQAAPVPVSVIEERFGRLKFPEEVLYFKRGLVGLKRHFPDFDGWMARLVPVTIELMQERPAGRQWLVPELHDALREKDLVPDWLGHWQLASLLRLSGQVDYLGRLRVATKNSEREQERIQYEELLESVLVTAGGPLTAAEVIARAREHSDIVETTANLRLRQAPFVRLDEERVGLIERDIPGGPTAVAAAIETVVRTLASTQYGLTPHQAAELVNAQSDDHATWSRQLVVSVLRNEPSIRIDRHRNIGLDDWDDNRCPSQAEFLRLEVQGSGGVIPIDDLYDRFESFYGRAPDRSSLGVLAREAGIVLSGGMATRLRSVLPEAPPPRSSINLTGIPTELREMFEELVQERLSEPLDLRARVAEHLQAIEKEHLVNEFVDVAAARILARQCEALIDRWDTVPVQDRHLMNAAVRYFVSWDDVENDFELGGLDDDKQIVGAVMSYLGMTEGYEAVHAA